MERTTATSARGAQRPRRHSERPGRGADAIAGKSRALCRLVIVTGVRLFRDGLAHILADRAPHIAVESAMPDAALASRLAATAPEVVLLDFVTLRRAGVADTLRTSAPTARLVVFAVADDEDEIVACARAGVTGFVTRDATVDDLVVAIERALDGRRWCSERAAELMWARLAAPVRAGSAGVAGLTARERDVVKLMEAGLSNKQIAGRLFIETSTVKNHVHNVLEKLQVKRRWEASAVMRRDV